MQCNSRHAGYTWQQIKDDIKLLYEVCGKVRSGRLNGGAMSISKTKMIFHTMESEDGIPTGYHLESHSASHWVTHRIELLLILLCLLFEFVPVVEKVWWKIISCSNPLFLLMFVFFGVPFLSQTQRHSKLKETKKTRKATPNAPFKTNKRAKPNKQNITKLTSPTFFNSPTATLRSSKS